MPSRGQNGGAMNESFAQQLAQTPSPSTGSRQATHNVGSAMSSASFTACDHAPRNVVNAERRWEERGRDASASMMVQRLSSGSSALKRQDGAERPCRSVDASLAQQRHDLR